MKILKTQLCIFHSRGECNRGDRCSFAHCLRELRERPNFKKSKLCYAYRADNCYNPHCNFAHGEQELVPSELTHKKALCKLFAEGNCRDGEQCTYAHSIDEVRTRCIFTPPLPPPPALCSPPGFAANPTTVNSTVKMIPSGNKSTLCQTAPTTIATRPPSSSTSCPSSSTCCSSSTATVDPSSSSAASSPAATTTTSAVLSQVEKSRRDYAAAMGRAVYVPRMASAMTTEMVAEQQEQLQQLEQLEQQHPSRQTQRLPRQQQQRQH
eukprot:GHVS01023609.1.p1 GENE.GHVS01023609.1~~GHVS01023609.1.p1  ORF type:complete len:266 (+),score=51.96 GHVS01023609.1:243-1040(+)